MSTDTHAHRLLHPVQRLLGAVATALDEVDDPGMAVLGDREIDALVVGLETAVSRLRVRSLAVLAEGRRRNRAAQVGATSHPVWVAQLLRVTPGDAARMLHAAGSLDAAAVDPVTARIPADARRGVCGTAQAVVSADAVDALPDEVSPGARAAAMDLMLEYAPVMDPADLGEVGRRLLETVDPELGEARLARQLADQERRAVQSRGLTMNAASAGMVRGRFTLPESDAAIVLAALRPLAAPRPCALAPGADPEGAAGPAGTAGAAGPDAAAGADRNAAVAAGATRDPRNHAQRMSDALVELAERSLVHGDLPDTGGDRPQLVVLTTLAQLESRTGIGETLDGTPMTPAALRRFACDASVMPVVMGGTGQPLDVGRETRVVPIGLRRALALRDRGCAFPGCDRPPGWTDAHHVRHWADGGGTAIGNLVLLCGHHHRTVHRTPWRVLIRPDGHPEWQPPPWVAPPGTRIPGRPRTPTRPTDCAPPVHATEPTTRMQPCDPLDPVDPPGRPDPSGRWEPWDPDRSRPRGPFRSPEPVGDPAIVSW